MEIKIKLEVLTKGREVFFKGREIFFCPGSFSTGFPETHAYFRPESVYDPLSNPESLEPKI